MKRRDFVKTLPLMMAFPSSVFSYSPKSTEMHLVALGSSASKVLIKYGNRLEYDSYTIVDGKKPEASKVKFDYFPFSPPESAIMKFGDFKVQKTDILPELILSEEIMSALAKKSGRVTVFAGLGNVSGTMLYQAIGTQLGKKLKDICMLGTVPFRFEGIRRRNNAFQAIRSVNGKTPQTILYLDRIRDIHGNLSIQSAFATVDDWILKTLATDSI